MAYKRRSRASRRYPRRSRRLASSGMQLRSGRKIQPRGSRAALVGAAGAAARGAKWLWNSELGKRARSAAAGYAVGRVMKRQRETPTDAGAGQQYEKYNFKFGKYQSKRRAFDKLLRRDMAFQVQRFGATQPFANSVSGAFQLARITTGSTQTLPMHILELTNIYPGPSPTNMNVVDPFTGFAITTATGFVNPVTIGGRANDGTTLANHYHLLSTNANEQIGDLPTIRNGILEWTNAKLLFRCPKRIPGWFKVSLVQFTEEKILPRVVSTNLNDQYHGFWQKRAKALLYNPIAHEISGANRPGQNPGMTVLKTWVRRWNPDTSDNLATYSGAQIRLDLFIRHNKFCNMKGNQAGAHTSAARLVDDAYVADDDFTVAGEAESLCYNHPARFKGRVFLLIEATDFSDGQTGAFNPDWHVSFDMEVRNKWIYREDQ